MSTHDGGEMYIGVLVGKLEGKTHLEDLIIDERLTLKMDLEIYWEVWGLINVAEERVKCWAVVVTIVDFF